MHKAVSERKEHRQRSQPHLLVEANNAFSRPGNEVLAGGEQDPARAAGKHVVVARVREVQPSLLVPQHGRRIVSAQKTTRGIRAVDKRQRLDRRSRTRS